MRTDLQLKFVATLICVASRQILRHYDKLIIFNFPGKLNKPRADGKMGAINEPFSRKESILIFRKRVTGSLWSMRIKLVLNFNMLSDWGTQWQNHLYYRAVCATAISLKCRKGEDLEQGYIFCVMFSVVQNSSIGDLVTH